MSTPEHLTGRNVDSGATASIDSAHMQSVVQRKMAAAELARQRGARDEAELQMELRAEEARAKVGTRKDGSFGLLNDEVYEDGEVRNEEEIVKPLDRVDLPVRGTARGVWKNREREDEIELEGEKKDEPQLKRRVSKMWKSAIVKIRGPAVARGL